MKYYHSIFKQLHFDYGRMLWSTNHMPFFGAIMSVCDHRSTGSMHSISFYAFLRVLTDGKINKRQADAIFALIDISSNGEISFSEMAFWAGIIVAQKDHLEREFLYMHAWKIWVTFNEKGADQVTSGEFRRAGLFFDFDYPTIYHMYRDYNWDDDKKLGFERFRFYLISCVHFRSLRRATAKYLRYKKFKVELLEVLQAALVKVLRDNMYPAPTTILRAIRSVKIPPIEGQEKFYHWSDVFTLQWARRYTYQQWDVFKMRMLLLMRNSSVWRCICRFFCCGMCCLGAEEDMDACGKCCTNCTRNTWNWVCCCCCLCGCCGTCLIKKGENRKNVKPIKPVVIRRDVDIKKLVEIERRTDLFVPKRVEFYTVENEWRSKEKKKKACGIQ